MDTLLHFDFPWRKEHLVNYQKGTAKFPFFTKMYAFLIRWCYLLGLCQKLNAEMLHLRSTRIKKKHLLCTVLKLQLVFIH